MESNPTIPDIHRRGDDLIARIDELARARHINPEAKDFDYSPDLNGWIYLLIACRRQLVFLAEWKQVTKDMTVLNKSLTAALQRYQSISGLLQNMTEDSTSALMPGEQMP